MCVFVCVYNFSNVPYVNELFNLSKKNLKKFICLFI